MIEEILGSDWIVVNRFTRFYIQGKFYKYPVELLNTLKNLGLVRTSQAALDYILSKLKKVLFNPPINNFEDFVIMEFGRTLANLNMINYTEKIWGIPSTQISADWARQRIKGLSFLQLLKKVLFKGTKGPKTLVDQFYYPRFGASQTYEKMAEIIQRKGAKIMLSSRVVGLRHEESRITFVITRRENKSEKELPVDFAVSSIPLTEVVQILKPEPPVEILKAASLLKWRFQVYLHLQLKKERIGHDNWVYFPDKEISFGRVHEPKNFSTALSPSNRTSLWVEHFVFQDDERWNCSKEKLYEITITDLERLGFIKRDDVLEYHKHREEHVYPIYETGYLKQVKIIKDYLKRFTNLQLIGRGGRFRYNNQDHSIETGVLAARNIIEKGNYNLEKVGAEQEYFEKGYIKRQ